MPRGGQEGALSPRSQLLEGPRHFLVWSKSKRTLFCFLAVLCNKHSTLELYHVQESSSKLPRPNAGIIDNWRKLYMH